MASIAFAPPVQMLKILSQWKCWPRKSVFAQFDLDKDGKLSKTEAAMVTEMGQTSPKLLFRRGSGSEPPSLAGGSLYEGNHQLRFATSHLGLHCSSAEEPSTGEAGDPTPHLRRCARYFLYMYCCFLSSIPNCHPCPQYVNIIYIYMMIYIYNI